MNHARVCFPGELPRMIGRIEVIRAGLSRIQASGGASPAAPASAPRFADLLVQAMRTPGGEDRGASDGPGHFDDIVRLAADRFGLSPEVIHAVIRAESGYDPSCTSPAGAMGLMQLMPGTARALGVSNAYDPAQNILGGSRYLRAQLDRFGDLSLALAAYNAGPGAVARYGGIPPYRETQTYVRRVLGYLARGTEGAR